MMTGCSDLFDCSYGIRYQYGLFRQTLQDGFQHEQPDYWLNVGNPWEIERVHVTYPISVSPLSPQ
jgi:glucan phosphorylase